MKNELPQVHVHVQSGQSVYMCKHCSCCFHAHVATCSVFHLFFPPPLSLSSLIRDIIKLTAQFVARNGAQFMDQLMMREQKNETFDFLRKNHILFTYFTKIVEQYSKVNEIYIYMYVYMYMYM